MSLSSGDLYRLIDASWPAATKSQVGPFTVREGRGGGGRVSATTLDGPFDADAIGDAEAAIRALGQTPLFMIRSGEDPLDAALGARGYGIKDPVIGFSAPVERLLPFLPPPVTAFEIWPPIASEIEIWASGGIGPARLAVMDRAPMPKTTIMGRLDDRPAGVAFVSMDGRAAMIHAVEVAPHFRRRGLGQYMLAAAARWVRKNGGTELALIVTRANAGAQALYASLGMSPVGQYHYRIHPEGS